VFVLRKIGKLSLGVATFVPLLYMAAFLGLGVYMAGTAHNKQSDALMFRLFPLIITMHMAVGFLWMALYAYNRPRLQAAAHQRRVKSALGDSDPVARFLHDADLLVPVRLAGFAWEPDGSR
jgi:hypothetical protein